MQQTSKGGIFCPKAIMIANQLKDSFKRSCTYVLDAGMINTLLWLIHLQLQLADFLI
jgi:hypothetical protein